MNNFVASTGALNTVFISYARADRADAERLAKDLAQLGFGGWIDSENLRPLALWEKEIHFAIQRSSYFFVLISSKSTAVESYVPKEVAYALTLERQLDINAPFIIPLRTENVLPHEGLRSRNTIDMFPNWEAGIRAISALTRPEQVSAMKRSLMRFFVLGALLFWGSLYAYIAFSAAPTELAGVAGNAILLIVCTLTALLVSFISGSFIMNFVRVRRRSTAIAAGLGFSILVALIIYAIASSA